MERWSTEKALLYCLQNDSASFVVREALDGGAAHKKGENCAE